MSETVCLRCEGYLWVCENHTAQPWNDSGCTCGAGEPCPDCNPSTGRDDPPRMPPGFEVLGTINEDSPND